MNADRNLCGPCSTDLDNPNPLFCMHNRRFLQLLRDVTYCTYFISYNACGLCLFIAETLCMYLAWYPLHCFYPVNNKFINFKMFVAFLIVLGFNDTSTLEGHFVSSPREREKRDRRESRGDEREGQGRKRNRNESEETEEIKTFPLYPYPLQG